MYTIHEKIYNNIKLLLSVSILILIYIIIFTSLITTQYEKSSRLTKLQNSLNLATKISQLVHETQKERGYSSAYITSGNQNFKKKLDIQRVLTDEKLIDLKKFLSQTDITNIEKEIQAPLEALLKIEAIREKIDTTKINSSQIIKYYSDTNNDLLDVIVEISKFSKVPTITKETIAYYNFLYAKENAGIERALGASILAQDSFKANQRVEFMDVISTQNIYLKTFKQYSSKEKYEFYKESMNKVTLKKVEVIRKKVLSNDENFGVSTEVWLNTITKKINELQTVDENLEKNIFTNIQKEIDSTNISFISYIIFHLLGILIFILIIVFTKKLIKSERRLKELADKYIINSTTDLKGKITSVSDAFCEISQYTREELIGKPHSIVRHPDVPQSTFRDMWKSIQNGKRWQGEVKNLKKDGSYYWVYANIEPLVNKKGKIEGYTAIRLDITDRINLENSVLEGKKKDKLMMHQAKLAQMGEMISMIAHQWRQPLSAIHAVTNDLLFKQSNNKYNEEYFNSKLNNIIEFSNHLSSTIDDFRNFYKEDKEKFLISYQDVIQNSLVIVGSLLKFKGINIELNFKTDAKIYTYPNELQQVVLNLIKNAEDILLENKIKNPSIKIKTYKNDNKLILEISDNAGGVPEDIMEKIFEPYYSTKTKKDGTGLGLYMSKTIIEDHCDGNLTVSNNKDGAVFKIELYS